MDWLRFYLPILVYAVITIFYTRHFLGKGAEIHTHHYGVTALAIQGGLLYMLALGRYDYIHVIPTTVFVFLLVLLHLEQLSQRISRPISKYTFFLLLAIITNLYYLGPIQYKLASIMQLPPSGCFSQLEKASCIFLNSDQEKAVNHMMTQTREGEAIFVGNLRSDLPLGNDVGFYFLADRPSATFYHELHPGISTTLQVQEKIVHEIESKNVSWIVLLDSPGTYELTNISLGSGVRFLENYFNTAFEPIREYGKYSIWRKVAD
jgi:hypothetical protein